MLASLPPGTSSFLPLGSITLQLTPIYLNSLIKNPKYSLKLWGIQDKMHLQQISNPSLQQKGITLNNNQSLHEIKFQVTTNLAKLTGYFRDMGILIIIISDSRSNKQIGISYVKVRRYIINDLLSEFQQKAQIISADCQTKNTSLNKKVLGQINIRLRIDVPINGNSIERPTSQAKNKKEQLFDKESKGKLMPDPYIFQNIYENQENYLHKKKDPQNQRKNNILKTQEQFQPSKDRSKSGDYQQAKDLLFALQTKPKVTSANVLDFIIEDSVNNTNKYPNISQLHRKYGPNNVYAERMKLKLDEAKYLNPIKQMQTLSYINNNIQNENQKDDGWVCRFRNFQILIGGNKDIRDLSVRILSSEKDDTIIIESLIKELGQGGVYVRNLLSGNVIQIQNKFYKTKHVIKKVNIQGEAIKMYLRRKDSNKKIAQFDLLIQKIHSQNTNKHNNQSPNKNINKGNNESRKQRQNKFKSHFYISLKQFGQSLIKNKFKKLNYVFSIHPQCQKQSVKGKKMIFTAQNTLQRVKVRVQASIPQAQRFSPSNNETLVTIDPSIKMKEEIIQIEEQKFRVFIASADTIENLMKIVVLYDEKEIIQKNETQNSKKIDQNEQQTHNQSRQQKLKLLFKCFYYLISTTNNQCMQIIKKLHSPSISSQDQIILFEQMCKNANIPAIQVQMITRNTFVQLLHGQFSMFWTCFQQYRRWNDMYHHALNYLSKSLYQQIYMIINRNQQIHNNIHKNKQRTKYKKLIQKCIQKVYKNKQQLFGLLSYQKCERILTQYIRNKLLPSQDDNPNLNQYQGQGQGQCQGQINKVMQQKGQQNKLPVYRQRLQKVLTCIRNILSLLCRYTGTQSIRANIINIHCIRTNQLSTILSNMNMYNENPPNIDTNTNTNTNININQHQLLAISQSQPKQLLLQVIQSCISSPLQPQPQSQLQSNSIRSGCHCLSTILLSIQKIQTEQSSTISEQHGRIQTDNITYNHIYTQQPQRQRLQTDDINHTYININNNMDNNIPNPNPNTNTNTNTNPYPNNNPKNHPNTKNTKNKTNTDTINIKLKQLIINNQQIYPIDTTNTDILIQIFNTDKNIIHTIPYSHLPKTIQLQTMYDYRIVIQPNLTNHHPYSQPIHRIGNAYATVQANGYANSNPQPYTHTHNDNSKMEWFRLEGVFIANDNIDRILLYGGLQAMEQVGYILANKQNTQYPQNYQQHQQQQQQQLVLQIKHKTTTYPNQQQQQQQQQQHQQQNHQQQQQQNKQITKIIKQPNTNTIPLHQHKIIQYKILSVWPPVQNNTSYQILIQGVQKIIQYPYTYCIGTITNKNIQQYTIPIHITIRKPQCKNITPHPNRNHDAVHVHKTTINKISGVQQIIVQNQDGRLQCIVTIQLYQYTGNIYEQHQQSDNNIQHVIHMNIYHLQSYKKLQQLLPIPVQNQNQSQQHLQHILVLIITNQSDTQPIYIKQIDINQNNSKCPYISHHPRPTDPEYCIRTQWIGISARVSKSKLYNIHVYRKPHPKHKQKYKYKQKYKQKQQEQYLLAHFQFSIKYHPEQIGIFESKGYLVDQNACGHRLAIDVLEINYNDIFSKNIIGREKFQSLLKIFEVDGIMKMSKAQNTQRVKTLLRSYYGFNNTQIHLLFQLQRKQNQIFSILINWDVDVLIYGQSINLSSHSILDIFSEFQIYDFFNSGAIPKAKAELVNMLTFDLNKISKSSNKGFINLQIFHIHDRQGWVKDLKSVEMEGNIDYLLILWSLRRFAIVDNFFINGPPEPPFRSDIESSLVQKNAQNSTNINQTINQSVSKIKVIKIQMLGYKNLRIGENPGTLTFYINGQKISEPIPRCFTHQYQNPKTIITNYPIILEVYNKIYGIKSLFQQQLIQTVKIYQQKVQLLGGQIYFLIQQDNGENILNKNQNERKKPRNPTTQKWNNSHENNSDTNIILHNNSIGSNQFRKSRRQKWQNLKNQDQNTKKIAQILKARTRG